MGAVPPNPPVSVPVRPSISPDQAKEIHTRQMAEMLYMQMVVEDFKKGSNFEYKSMKEAALEAAREFMSE